MNNLFIAAAAIAALGFVTASTAEAGGTPCPRWECGTNGRSLNGIETNGVGLNDRYINGVRHHGWDPNGRSLNGAGMLGQFRLDANVPLAAADQPFVNAVTLPSGETIDLR